MYHMINYPIKNAKFNKLRVSPRSFQKQVRYLKDRGYQFIFMSELAESEENCVALTFDDGYRDNLVHADKILEEVGGKATLYLVCDRHGRDWSVTKKAKHNSGEFRDEDNLSHNDVKTMLSNGRWELGAHTVTHAHLPSIDHADLYREITRSKEILEKTFDVNVKSFAIHLGSIVTEMYKLLEMRVLKLRVLRGKGFLKDAREIHWSYLASKFAVANRCCLSG